MRGYIHYQLTYRSNRPIEIVSISMRARQFNLCLTSNYTRRDKLIRSPPYDCQDAALIVHFAKVTRSITGG
jgi:hypothetical protein